MLLARVEGNVTSTRKHPSFQGFRMVLCQPVNSHHEAIGNGPIIALDPYGAGKHQIVILSSDGKAARHLVNDDQSPARYLVIAIQDQIHNS
ncbi:MAG: EutN/CcmL family microcompartment protein [Opitutales bacterium]|nr:EutN/CcmL family microcompartment protein [Opitutales bacterium]MCH8541454.1 EutN/CcmL family microcompartment protein [Opitutales bacterium]